MVRISAALLGLLASSNAANAAIVSAQPRPVDDRNKLTPAQEIVKFDQEARDDFERRCEVVVTVSDDKFLPVKPLDRFCQTTDAVVECRMKVGQRLKETHARDGDMGKFCSAVYDWFQGKYGMKCPSQCKKLQCKGTCKWIDEKKKLNKDNAQIKGDMESAEKALKAIKALGEDIHNKIDEAAKVDFNIKMHKKKIGRSKQDLDDKKMEHKEFQVKLGKIDGVYKKLQDSIEAAKESLIKQDDDLMKAKFAIDKAKLKHSNMLRAVDRTSDKAKEDREEQASFEKDAGKVNKSIVELDEGIAALAKGRSADQKAAQKADSVVKEKVKAMIKACRELDAWKVDDGKKLPAPKSVEEEYNQYMSGNYKNAPEVPIIKELVQNQHTRVKAAEKALEAINKKIRDASDEIKSMKADRSRLQEQHKEAMDSANAAKKEAGDLEAKVMADTEAAEKLKENEVDKPTKKYEESQSKRKKTDEGKQKAERTLKLTGEALQEQRQRVSAAEGAVNAVDLQVKGHQKDLEEAEAQHKKLLKQEQKMKDNEKMAKKKLEKDEKELVERIKVYKTAVKDLDKHKPEIVRLHGLQPEL